MSRRVVNRSTGRYSSLAVLEVLHSPSALILLNPLVCAHSQIPSPPDAPAQSTNWSITDSLTLMGCFSTKTTYTAVFTPSERAMDTVCLAAMGVVSKGVWKVEEDGTIVEEGELEAPWWLMGYVYGQWKASHALLLNRLEEQLHDQRLPAKVLEGETPATPAQS